MNLSRFRLVKFGILDYVFRILKRQEEIMAKLNELAIIIGGLEEQLSKATAEITGKISDLEDKLAAVDIPAEAMLALDELKVAAQKLDDIVPDVVGG